MTHGTPASFYEDKFLPGGVLQAALFLARGTRDLFAFFSYVQPWTGLLFGALAILGMARLRGHRAGAVLAPVFAGVLAAAAAASAARLYPYGGTRQMLFAAPLFYVLAAAGIAALRTRWHGLPAGLILTAIVVGSVIFLHRYHAAPGGQEMRPVVRALEGALRPGDRILVNKDALPQFRFYYRGDPGRVVAGRATVMRDYLAEINETLAAAPEARWWLVFSHGWSTGRRDELRGVDPRFAAGARFEAHRAGAYLVEPRPAPAGGAGVTGGGPPP
jgi:hypothetical protein